ncbi:hypothetical protein P1J78_04785 [Psychromarinibacter sp. C21-152]|uniref:Tetratricopeptide repeat-containing protein n=1 Tax=Psychromarinibacter sediminicola TaxID=3033385 RepID=A0AAE3NQ46_9RHOB|nr:hypothetical protein [Psychromarinibacter sediminicola]MDF0600041.1 hypothetical protein [Psychromarinibacter sediminicola]
MRRTVSRLRLVPPLVLASAAAALAQGGGFVFDAPAEPAPPEATKPDPAPKETDAAAPSLEDFTFGGAPTAPTADSVPGPEQVLWDEVVAANTQEGFRRYLDAHPDGAFAAEARRRLAELQAEADRRAGLVAACDRLAGDPEDPGLSAGAGGVAVPEIDADAALWTCSRARAAEPDLPRLAYNLGRISEAQGQRPAALRSYRTAIRMAVEQDGAPHLPAAAGLLRLSEPRNPTERMLNTMLQLSIEEAGRGAAQQARIAELEAALAEARAAGAAAGDRLATLKAQMEAATAREMELSAELSGTAGRIEALRGEKAELEEQLAVALAAGAEAEQTAAARADMIDALRAETQALQDELDAREEALANAQSQIASLGEQLNTALAQIAALRVEAAEEAQ